MLRASYTYEEAVRTGLNWQIYETRSIQCGTVRFKQVKISRQKNVTSSYFKRDQKCDMPLCSVGMYQNRLLAFVCWNDIL